MPGPVPGSVPGPVERQQRMFRCQFKLHQVPPVPGPVPPGPVPPGPVPPVPVPPVPGPVPGPVMTVEVTVIVTTPLPPLGYIEDIVVERLGRRVLEFPAGC